MNQTNNVLFLNIRAEYGERYNQISKCTGIDIIVVATTDFNKGISYIRDKLKEEGAIYPPQDIIPTLDGRMMHTHIVDKIEKYKADGYVLVEYGNMLDKVEMLDMKVRGELNVRGLD